ncbi:MAG: tetratricopeptide repeat protein [Phycisphaerales bacterium]|nr:MAG: tetratricopeptide repeat protein [Phycisphaerales bacterium]
MTAPKTVVITALVCLAAHPATASAKLPPERLRSLFDQANQAFREANAMTDDPEQAARLYENAILNYEKIINDGQIQNPGLYYNLANAYFLNDDIARAILNYRRAEKLDSSDTNIQKNLAFARSKTIDRFEIKTQRRVLHTLFFWHYDFAIKTRFFLACLFFAITCAALTATIWLGRKAPATAAAVIGALLTVCFLLSVAIEVRHESRTVCGVITAPQIVARQGDGNNYPPSFKEPLHAGAEFDLLERRPGWLRIRLPDETDCWIPDNAAQLI